MPEKKKFTPRLKSYHLFLLSIILCPILILNSNYVNKKRLENKLNEEAKVKFDKIIFGRRLDEYPEDTEKICKKGSDDQKEYYKTGDGSKIGIKDGPISSEDRPDYINNLIDIVKSSSSDSGEGSIDVQEKLTPYIKHLFPVIFFLAVTILAIPGWVMCCSCCCANCCCCCCLKKSICKLPFFIITYACYGIVFVVSIYGLSQSNSIFVGLADTECSLLKFVGDVLYGENKETTPKWGGIENIKDKLDQTSIQFQNIKNDDLNILKVEKARIEPFKPNFETQSNNIKDNTYYQYTENTNTYTLDLAYDFGTIVSDYPSPSNSFVYNWTMEYAQPYLEAGVLMGIIEQSFTKLINGENNVDDDEDGIIKTLEDIKVPINDIKTSIDNVKDQISGIIIDYSDTIDQYGKLGFKIVFSVLTVFVAAIAAIMLLLCFCSGKKCSSCCLFRCGFKIILHILWNILAFLMILTFLIGTIFLLFGTIGGDLVSVVSFVVSSENLSKGKDEIALLGEAADKLTVCLNGDGKIAQKLGVGEEEERQLEILKSSKVAVEDYQRQFRDLKARKKSYNDYNNKLNERAAYSTLNFGLKDSNGDYIYKLQTELDNINRINDYEKLSFSCPVNDRLECVSGIDKSGPKKCYDLKYCNYENYENRYNSEDESLKTIFTRIFGIIKNQNNANSDSSTIPGIKFVIEGFKQQYDTFLDEEDKGLEKFRKSIARITDIYDDWVNENDKFLSFLNCKFMGKNIKVVLKFLEKSLGSHFKTVGICLLLSGFSLAIAIIFTILLMSILKENAGK